MFFVIAFLITPLFFVHADNETDAYVYIQGKNEYERNGIVSFTSEEDVVLSTTSNTTGDITINVYESNKEDLLQFLLHDGEYKQINEKPYVRDDQRIEVRTVRTGEKFPISVGTEGIYIVHAHAQDAESYAFVVRSRVGAVVKESKEGLIFWAQDIKTRKKASGVKVKIYDLYEDVDEKESVATGDDGVALTKTSVKYDVAIVESGRSIALVPLNLSRLGDIYYEGYEKTNDYPGQTQKAKYFTFIDRPLYRPGDTIYFKTIVRYDDDQEYLLPEGGKWMARVVRGWGDEEQIVAQGDFVSDSYGTFSGEFILPADVQTGDDFRLEIERTDREDEFSWWNWGPESTYFSVEQYRKPEYSVNVNIDRQEYINGDSVIFDVSGRYFSGEALDGGQVVYDIYENDFYDYTYYDDVTRAEDRNSYGYYGYDAITSGTVHIGADGMGQGTFAPRIVDGKPHIYTVEVSYTSVAGEPVVDQENILVYPAEYGIYRQDHMDASAVGEEYVMDAILHPYRKDAKISQQELHVVIERTWWVKKEDESKYDRYEEQNEIVREFDAISDRSGHVPIAFTPTLGGSYHISVAGTDQYDNHTIKEFYAWITEKNVFVAGQGSEGFTISCDKGEYAPGDSMDINVSAETPDRDLFVTVERDFVHEYHVVHMDGYDEDFDITLDDYAMPQITLGVEGFDRTRLNAAQKKIVVSAEQQKLDINLIVDRKMYAPGETVTVDVMTKDHKGRPQKADVALWAVDKALFELKEPGGQDIFASFWGESSRYAYTQGSDSLRSISIETAESGGCFVAGTTVLMQDGTQKNIEDVREGDAVLTRTEISNELVTARVSKTHAVDVPGYFVINGTLHVTGEHVIWTNNTWKAVYDLRIGDVFVNSDQQEIIVESIEWVKRNVTVYNIEVEEYHAYFANGIFVHNGKDGGARTIFKDMAYWNPHVRTGDDGKARITFTLPDDLTTWVVSAIGVTNDTKVSNEFVEIMTTKPIMVRPYMPNILRKDDQLTVVATVQNTTTKNHTLDMKLDFDGGDVENVLQEITVAPESSKIVSWNIVPKKENIDALMRFSAVDQNDHTINDVVEKHILIEQYGFEEKNSFSHADGKSYTVAIADDAYNEKTHVEVTVASTMLHSLRGAMTYLIRYPYGCVEQTTSAMVPAILAKENSLILREAAQGKDLDAMIAKGVDRLQKYQNDEGGWELWGGEKPDLFLSVYAVEQLLRAQAVGVSVDENVLMQAKEYFDKQNFDSEDERILGAYGRSLFGNTQGENVFVDENTPSDLLALGVIANLRNGQKDPTINGYSILISRLQRQGETLFLPMENSKDVSYFSSTDTSTALALQAVLMAGSDMSIAQDLVEYIMNVRVKEYWSHTFATSHILMALTTFASIEQEEMRGGPFRVLVDDVEVAQGTVNNAQPVTSINIPVQKIKKGGSTVSIVSDHNPYSTIFMSEFHTDRNAQALSRGMSIERTYYNEKGKNYTIGVGDTVVVKLEVSGLQSGMRNLLIEDHLPSGMVPINDSFDNVKIAENDDRMSWTEHREYLLDGVVISDTHPSIATYVYRARVVSAGDFSVPPAFGFLMYDPEVYARTNAQKMHINEESQIVEIDGAIKKSDTTAYFKRFADKLSLVMMIIAVGASVIAIGVGIFAAVRHVRKNDV